MKSGFVNIFGRPNAGKSTLLNALMGEKMAIVSPKVQTTRHRIRTILNSEGYQIIFSDTPGIITPKYKLHQRMMLAVKNALEDADVALLIADITEPLEKTHSLFEGLNLKIPCIILLNKMDKMKGPEIKNAVQFFQEKKYANSVIAITALSQKNTSTLLEKILEFLPEGEPFFDDDALSDLPIKFFVSELIREKIYKYADEEIPYHTTVLIREYKEKITLTKIVADIIVHRESQKAILLGANGSMIKEIGTEARKEIESFIDQKVFLELFVKVKPKWRETDLYLKEYGY